MKNCSYLYVDDKKLDFQLHMTNYFKELRNYTKENFEKTTIVQVYKLDDSNIEVTCWHSRGKGELKLLLFSLRFHFDNSKIINIVANFPKGNDWVPVRAFNNIAVYPDKTVMSPIESPTDYPNLERVSVEVYSHPNKKEAKKIWKNIKKSGLVSKFYWDSWFQNYDCFCKACAVDSKFDRRWDFRSWVGNPDIGYVYNAWSKSEAKNTFEYKHNIYRPCDADDYLRLKFRNKEEYKEHCDWLGYSNLEKFSDIAKKRKITEKDIFENGNIEGSALRDKTTKKVYGWDAFEDPKSHDNLEIVVTKGEHTTDIPGAIECPVCRDLFGVFCHSVYNPIPLRLRLIGFFKKRYGKRTLL